MVSYSFRIVLVAFMFSFFTNFSAQTGSREINMKQGKLLIEKAYMNYDENMMLQARVIFENFCNSDKNNDTSLYYLTYIDYKLFEMNLRNGGDKIFDMYFDKAVSNAERLSRQKNWASEGKTLLSAIYMMKIATKPLTAVYLSPKIWGLLDEAGKINPENPRVYIIRGSMNFNTPKMFGGSYKNAADNFKTAVSLFERQDTVFTLLPSWGYAESLVWFGRSMEAQDSYEQARFAYIKALRVQPDYSWVKNILLPNVEKKIKQGN